MLAYILAIAVALSSIVLFFSAFFAPKLHRKDDFLWSGVGLFYGLILWVCAGRMTGGVLLGQLAAVVLILSFAWQTILLRAAIANPDKIAGIKTFSLLDWIGGGLGKKKVKVQPQVAVKPETKLIPEPENPVETVESLGSLTETIPPPVENIVSTPQIADPSVIPEASQSEDDESVEVIVEDALLTENQTEDNLVESSAKEKFESTIPPAVLPTQKSPQSKKQGFFSRFLGKKRSSAQPESITKALNAIDEIDDNAENSEDANESLENNASVKEIQVNQVMTETLHLEYSEEKVVETDTPQTQKIVETKVIEKSVTISLLPEESTENDWEEDWGDEDEVKDFEITTDESKSTILEAITTPSIIEETLDDESLNTSTEVTSSKVAPYSEEDCTENPVFKEETSTEIDSPTD